MLWNRKRQILWLVIFTLAAITTSLGGAIAENSKPLRVIYHNATTVGKIDPHKNQYTFVSLVVANIFQPLFSTDLDENLKLGAAQSLVIDGNKVILTLRDDLKWSDGAPITAKDFESGIRRGMQYGFEFSSRALAFVGGQDWLDGKSEDFPGVRATDDKTIVLEMNTLDMSILSGVHPWSIPFPNHIDIDPDQSWGEVTFVSNGRYIISPESEGGNIILIKNPMFSSGQPGTFERIVFDEPVLDHAVKDFSKGGVDLVLDVPFKQLAWVLTNLADNFVAANRDNMIYVAFDTRKPLLQNRDIRRAAFLASHQEVLVKTALGGIGKPLFTPFPEQISRLDQAKIVKDLARYEDRVEEAKLLMKAAGYSKETPLKIKLGYFNINTFRTIAFALDKLWADIGIDVELVRFDDDFSVMMDAMFAGDLDAFVVTWHFSRVEPEAGMTYLRSFSPTSNWGSFYDNPKFRELIEAIGKLPVPDETGKKDTLLRQAERQLFDDNIIATIGSLPNGMLISDDLEVIDKSALGLGSLTNFNNFVWR